LDILIVEDEAILALTYMQCLQELGIRDVEHAFCADEALRAVERSRPKLILLDIKLGDGRDGIEVAKIVRRRYDVPIVFISAFVDMKTLNRAWSVHPAYILKKDGQYNVLKAVVTELLEL
jgi:CheY-like chemotaxis protein